MQIRIPSCCAFAIALFASASVLAQTTSSTSFATDGGRVLTRPELEKLLTGAQVSLSDEAGGVQTWTHPLRGALLASLKRAGNARPVNGQGTATIDQNGAYCVKIEWPQAPESWCRRVLLLRGSYYTLSEGLHETHASPLHINQPNAAHLAMLSRLWSLARVAGSNLR